MVLTWFWFLIIFNKSKVLASCSFPPQISHQNCDPKSTKIHNNQKNHDPWKSRSRARGVAKTVFGVPMLHGKHFFLIAMQRGNAICAFCDTSTARMRFFHFCRTCPARSSKIMNIASWSHAADVSARKMQKANRHQNRSFLWRLRTGRSFWHLQKFN